ncbi:hypothetical protein, partial [Streptomyces minutiscleroticus]|uniref:hypothetical protein n=1 Tax=Streptomyces minutiscleroticus TaxID=68238 RepID=UPI003322C2F0
MTATAPTAAPAAPDDRAAELGAELDRLRAEIVAARAALALVLSARRYGRGRWPRRRQRSVHPLRCSTVP